MTDLSLVPLEEILDEIEKRHVAYIIAFMRIDTANEPIVSTHYTGNKFIDCLGMCSVLEEDLKKHYMTMDEEYDGA